jgi:uncharacterized protein
VQKYSDKLIIFAKAPVLGEVKTRLQPEYSLDQSLKLHQLLVHNTLEKTKAFENLDVELCCAPNRNSMFFLHCENNFPVRLTDQLGEELGERMAFAFSHALQTSHKVIIIGTDCPELDKSYIESALQALDKHDAVIGPAADGGYVLLGLKQFSPELFSDFSWGTSSVLKQTRAVLKQLGWSWHELETRHDLDRPEDLTRFTDLKNEIN